MQRPALSEVSIRFLKSGDQLGPIVFRNRSAVDLNPGAEAPLSARCYLWRVEWQGLRDKGLCSEGTSLISRP